MRAGDLGKRLASAGHPALKRGERGRTRSSLSTRVRASASDGKVVVPSLCFVATAGLVDAAFSGDWSRIGAISTGTEDQLKLLCGALLLERLALVAWLGKAETQPLVLAKAFFGGTLSVLNELKTREGK
mmetsp:Transcript_11238/g.31316  ORF Transcript_11238/g.31316 Transcript_11238/m.31316 type:complete len:129 (+) Transcript_11238:341-727(+)